MANYPYRHRPCRCGCGALVPAQAGVARFTRGHRAKWVTARRRRIWYYTSEADVPPSLADCVDGLANVADLVERAGLTTAGRYVRGCALLLRDHQFVLDNAAQRSAGSSSSVERPPDRPSGTAAEKEPDHVHPVSS